ncbi:MAG: hypothetical protein ACK40X_04315 [Armatimonadota bacterium]
MTDSELVRKLLKFYQPIQAPAKYAVFKRWDKLDAKSAISLETVAKCQFLAL